MDHIVIKGYWVLKSDDEYDAEMRRSSRSIQGPLLISGFSFFALVLALKCGTINELVPPSPISWTKVIEKVPIVFAFSLGIFVIVLGLQILMRANFLEWNSVVICPVCNKIKSRDDQQQCQCGGEYIDIRRMMWVRTDTASEAGEFFD